MSFLTFSDGTDENRALRGANAPRQAIERDALRVARGSQPTMPNNAPAQNYRANMAGAHEMTAIQRAFVRAIASIKLASPTASGVQSWTGKRFSA